MGNFINYIPPGKDMEMATELQIEDNSNLISPQEWTYCEKERELAKFAENNAK
ncbi:hypothetical protein [Desulfotomaculum sp. 1211_IL3151]|uniref:hypothetical protein n=1 Tax=Desulfotomaculum sp. 1211_IL3151 TaxID=3084055 RepID=UPI002FDA0F46